MHGEDVRVGVFGGGVLHPRLMAGIVHEFNNLNAGVHCRLQLVLSGLNKDNHAERHLRESVEMLERAGRVAELFLQLATDRFPPKEFILPEIALRRAVAMQEPELTWGDIDIRLSFSGPPCWLFPDLLTHAVGNLLANAMREIEGGKERWIALDSRADAEWLTIRVSDSGKGYSPEQLEELARPLAESRAVQNAGAQHRFRRFGLGLFLTRWIVLVHGGTAVFGRAEAGGAACTIRIPSGRERSHPEDNRIALNQNKWL